MNRTDNCARRREAAYPLSAPWLLCRVRGGILQDVSGKVLLGVAIAAVVGLYWARPDLMVALLIVMAVGVYGWRHPDLDDWRGH